MFEQTNQTEEMNESLENMTFEEDLLQENGAENETDELFSLFGPDEEAMDQEDPDDLFREEPEQKEPAYTVKYNGQEMKLPLSKLIENAQKGMNYDKVVAQRDQLKASKEFELLDEFAKEAGMSRGDYIAYLEQKSQESFLQHQKEKGVPPKTALELYHLKQRDFGSRMNKLRQDSETQRREQFVQLYREYPQLTSLPDSVCDAIEHGETPLNAYRAYELKLLKDQLAAAEQNQLNRERSLGSMAGEGSIEDGDDFLAGFLS